MILQQPWWLVPAALAFVAFLILRRYVVKDNWAQVMRPEVYKYFTSQHGVLHRYNPALLIAALGFAALSGPSMPKDTDDNLQHSEVWFVAADVSRSMTLNDIAPSRMSVMRDTALAIAEQLKANSIALIIYAGDAFLVTPPSFDRSSYQSHVALLDYGLIPTDGSNLTRALSLILSITESSRLVNARVIILSDSGGMNNRAKAAIKRLYGSGHRTDIILFGSEQSATSAPFDLTAASDLATTGGGEVIVADKLGKLSIDSLSLDELNLKPGLLTQTGLLTMRYTNLSHWLLLFAIPLVLLLFYRERL